MMEATLQLIFEQCEELMKHIRGIKTDIKTGKECHPRQN
jgi:hypothetical protein